MPASILMVIFLCGDLVYMLGKKTPAMHDCVSHWKKKMVLVTDCGDDEVKMKMSALVSVNAKKVVLLVFLFL